MTQILGRQTCTNGKYSLPTTKRSGELRKQQNSNGLLS